jgi:hypothetical protein
VSSELAMTILFRNAPEGQEIDDNFGQGPYEATAEDYEAFRNMSGSSAKDATIDSVLDGMSAFDLEESIAEDEEIEKEFGDFDEELDDACKRDLPFQELKRDYEGGRTLRVTIGRCSDDQREVHYYREHAEQT